MQEYRTILGGEHWLGFARSCIKRLRTTGVDYAQQKFEMGDGSVVRAKITPTEDRIRIEGGVIYMESGFLERRSLAFSDPLTYKPAVVRFSPRVAQLTAQQTKLKLPNANGHKLKDGDDTWSRAGCRSKRSTVTVAIGFGDEAVLESDPPAFCNPDQMLEQKKLIEQVPPSEFTGKMRLFVQALYGSDRKDYRRAATIAGAIIEVSTHKFTVVTEEQAARGIEPREIFVPLLRGYPTHGLLTVAPEKYILVLIGADGVTFRRMTGSHVPTPKIAEHAKEREAYKLSTLVPSSDVFEAEGSFVYPAGATPFYYGWHFTEDGMEASIVITSGKEVSGIRMYDQSPNTIGAYTTQLLTMKFAYSETKDDAGVVTPKLSYGVSVVASGDYIPYLQTKVFFPIPNGLQVVTPPSQGPWNCYADLGPTPVYCYYDPDDTLVVVNTTNSRLRVEPGYNTNKGTLGELFGTFGPEASMQATEISRPTGYIFDNHGASVGEDTYEGTSSHYPGGSKDAVICLAVGETVTNGVPLSQGGYINTYMSKDPAKSYNYAEMRNDVTISTAVSIVIVAGDASAVICAVRDKDVGESDQAVFSTFDNNMPYSLSPAYPYPIPWAYAGIWVGRHTAAPDSIEGFNTVAEELYLHSGLDRRTISKYRKSNKPTEVVPLSPYNSLFTPDSHDGVTPAYSQRMTVRTSYFGAARFDGLQPQYTTFKKEFISGWPEDADAPIGWA